MTPEPAICPFDRIIVESVLNLNYNWTDFDNQQIYQEIIDAALIHAEQHHFGIHLAQWELVMYQQHVN